jgi:hypothetical protein
MLHDQWRSFSNATQRSAGGRGAFRVESGPSAANPRDVPEQRLSRLCSLEQTPLHASWSAEDSPGDAHGFLLRQVESIVFAPCKAVRAVLARSRCDLRGFQALSIAHRAAFRRL